MSAKSEKLQYSRQHLERPCWVTVSAGEPIICMLKDISEVGAKLYLPIAVDLPDRFVFYFTPDMQAARHCEIVRRTNDEIGLKFIGRGVPQRPSSEKVEI